MNRYKNMNRTEILLRKALKKIDELEKRIEKLEPKKPTHEWPRYDGDGKPLDMWGNRYTEQDDEQHDFVESDLDNVGEL
tara:strand:- start:610 stop:846 length:237 start_codon:yes stop_codon:yes gene_type:complete